MQVYGPDLLRYKGILYMKGINRRMLFQGVHMMMGAEPGKPWTAAEKPSTKMVFIGRKLPQEIFTRGLSSAWRGKPPSWIRDAMRRRQYCEVRIA